MPRIRCQESTCKHCDNDGYCSAKEIDVDVDYNSHNRPVPVCVSYEDKREENA